MQKKISIGLLLPSSTIAPMGKEFESGFRHSMNDIGDEWEVEVYPEFIAQGGTRKVEEALNKFFNYHQVDLVSGIISNRVAMDVASKFEKNKKPIVINNIGEHLPDSRKFNDYTFLNSTHTWQQVWSLANWAVKKFGKKGMFVSGMYDAGYNFMKMMSDGMQAGRADFEIPYSVAPLDNSNVYAQVEKVFEHIEMFKPDFVFAFFCGSEATLFLNEYVKKGYHKTIPLLSLPFLLEQFESNGESVTIYTSLSSAVKLEEGMPYKEVLSTFHQLGQQTGKAVVESLKQAGIDKLADTFKTQSEAGVLQIGIANAGHANKIYLIENKHQGDKANIEKHIMEELPTIHTNSNQFLSAIDEFNSAWENPYLGV